MIQKIYTFMLKNWKIMVFTDFSFEIGKIKKCTMANMNKWVAGSILPRFAVSSVCTLCETAGRPNAKIDMMYLAMSSTSISARKVSKWTNIRSSSWGLSLVRSEGVCILTCITQISLWKKLFDFYGLNAPFQCESNYCCSFINF